MSDGRLEIRVARLEQLVSELYRRTGETEPSFDESSAAQDERVVAALQAGNEIEAIKIYRGLTGAGLAEAKRAVDEIARFHKPIG